MIRLSVALQLVDQYPGGFAPDTVAGLLDRRERNFEIPGKIYIIIADQRDILRDASTALMDGPHGAYGQQVAVGENPVRRRLPLE